MKYCQTLTPSDRQLADRLIGFVPDEIFDIHTHPYHPDHFSSEAMPWLPSGGTKVLGCAEHRSEIQRYTPARTIHGLYFGMPHASANREAINEFVATQVETQGTELSRALALVTPDDNQEQVADLLKSRRFCGFKVYHIYSGRLDAMDASIEEYAPEWMWKLLNEHNGILLLHQVRTDAMADELNQNSLRRLCNKYPHCRVVLAHVARSFNYRNARRGLQTISDLDNVVVDTSAVTETESMRAALRLLGPRRVLFGSDFAVSEVQGRCVTTGNHFFWLHPDELPATQTAPTETQMTLIGIESLLTLQEACEDSGLNKADIKDIFLNNGLRLLRGHLPDKVIQNPSDGSMGPDLWRRAREVISCGTGLLSKRAEMFDVRKWPSYFSRCSGCEVWDLEGRRYIDFAGGIGAVLLGYADPVVTSAVRRRLDLGSYCSLVNPQEVDLAESLIALHPWAGKVRFARGGGDAMTVAVRIARAATGRSGVAFCGYHGWHDWYLAANLGDTASLDGHLLPGLEPRGVPRELTGTSIPFKYNDLDSLHSALENLGDNVAAVVMEPMRSQWPKDDFLQQAAAACRAKGAIFVVDEITSGLRYGFPGALSRLGVEPDIAVYAKAMSNGFPFGAVVGRNEIMSEADSSFISSSYWTDGVGPAAALAVLQKVQAERVHDGVWAKGLAFQEQLCLITAEFPSCQLIVGGMPATPTTTFNLGADSPLAQALYVRLMLRRGILASSVYYLMQAHQPHHIDQFLQTLGEVLTELSTIIASGRLAEESGVARGQRGFARLA